MKECNVCANFNCNTIRSEWPKMRVTHSFSRETLSSSCERYTPLETLKATVFELAMKKNPSAVVNVLKGMKMRFVEVGQKPYFTFFWDE